MNHHTMERHTLTLEFSIKCWAMDFIKTSKKNHEYWKKKKDSSKQNNQLEETFILLGRQSHWHKSNVTKTPRLNLLANYFRTRGSGRCSPAFTCLIISDSIPPGNRVHKLSNTPRGTARLHMQPFLLPESRLLTLACKISNSWSSNYSNMTY